jgi:hypothetical protein
LRVTSFRVIPQIADENYFVYSASHDDSLLCEFFDFLSDYRQELLTTFGELPQFFLYVTPAYPVDH